MSVKVRPFRNGGWEVDIQFCFPDGTRYRDRRKAPVKSESAARRWAEARERALLLKGERPSRIKEVKTKAQDVPTLEAFSERFMNEYARANREKPSGIATKESILRTHLVPLLGARRLDAITTADVQRLKATLRDRTPKTVNNVLTVLSVLMKTAVNWQLIERLPCTIRLVKTQRVDVDFHDFSHYGALVEAAKAQSPLAHLAVLLGGEAGLRCGEIIALEWSDVDLERRQITVARSEWRGHVTPPKSGRLRRLPMTDRLASVLGEMQRSRGRVLSNADGTSLTEHVLRGIVRRLAERAGVSPGLHILRHSFCSHLAMRGASGRAIQELAGHENLSTTQRYMHISAAALDAAIGLLNPAGPPPAVGDMLETSAK